MPPNGTASFGTFAFVELTFTKANTYETATLKRVVQTQTCTKRPPPNADCLNNRWGERDRQSSRSAVLIDAGGDFPLGGIQI